MGEFFRVFTASLLGAVLGSFISLAVAGGIVWHRYGTDVTAAAHAVSQLAKAQKATSGFKKSIEKRWHF